MRAGCAERTTLGFDCFGDKANGRLGGNLRRGHELADGVEHDLELPVVLVLQFDQLAREVRMSGEELAQAHEGADDQHTDLNGPRAVQDISRHDHAMFGEYKGAVPSSAASNV